MSHEQMEKYVHPAHYLTKATFLLEAQGAPWDVFFNYTYRNSLN